jgi:DNA-binding NtrC family response regulator
MAVANMLKILLVEDHQDLAAAMMVILDLLGHDARCGRSVAHAVELARERSFDVVLSDYALPDGTALDVSSRLKSLGLPVPVILLTAHTRDYFAPDVQMSFAGFLQKPVDLDQLDAMLQNVVPSPAV